MTAEASPGAPIAVGGVSGSGTRVVAEILQQAGVYIGTDLNESLDNLWFTLLFKHPHRLPERLLVDDPGLMGTFSVFEQAMEGRLQQNRTVRRYIQTAAEETFRHGINHRRDGHGDWAIRRAESLTRSSKTRRPAERWGWKEPTTMLLLLQMSRFFDDVRYVHVLRHPFEMASRPDQQDAYTWGRLFGIEPPYDPGLVIPLKYWLAANEQAIEQCEMLLPGRFLVLRFEELCADPAPTIERLLGFAGLDVSKPLAERLATIPDLMRPSSTSRDVELSVVPETDVERMRALGFEVEDAPATRPTHAPSAGPRRDGDRLSIAMCTFNGERFLPAQLDSLARQTRPPDEVVICDDRSTDATVRLLEEFRRSVPFRVRIEVNRRNLGSTKNFEKAIGLCEGDLIALCDQDDVWLPRKLERLLDELASRPGVAAMFSDAYLIDDASSPLSRGLWESYGFVGPDRMLFRRGEGFQRLLRANVVTGATMVFRSRFLDLVLPIPEMWVHDGWIAILLQAVSRLDLTAERLVAYRVHPAQQIGVPEPWQMEKPRLLPPLAFKALSTAQRLQRRIQLRRRMRKNTRAAMRKFGEYLRPVEQRLTTLVDRYPARANVFPSLEEVRRHNEARGEMELVRHRWPLIVDEWRSGRYERYSNGFSSAMKDLLLLDRPRRRTRDSAGI